MSTILQDLRYALRTLRKSPGYTAVAVAVLALGIGANTAVFSVINAVLLRPLPYPHSEQLLAMRERSPSVGIGSVSYPNYLDWRAGQRTCTDLALVRRDSFNVSFPAALGAPPERVDGATATANLMSIMGVRPALGRDFTEQEDTPGGPHSVLITDSLWRRRFNANPKVIGTSLTVEGISYEVIGVLPPSVQFPRRAELFMTLGDMRAEKYLLLRDNHVGFTAVGRLRPGVSVAQADQDLNRIARELARRYPEVTGWSVNLKTMLDFNVGDYRESLYLMLAAVGCVLLIACANVANLQLARASARVKELAVRAALGASRWRLVRQGLVESAVLGLLGGGAAVVLSLWAMDAIIALSPENGLRFSETRLDPTVFGFTVGLAVVTGVLVGVWPAWRVSGAAAMATALHEGSARGGSGSATQQRTRATLVVAQVALAVVLLAGAGVLLRSFWRAQSEPVGFRSDHLLTLSVSLPDVRYKGEKSILFFSQLLDRVRALPGVVDAATGVNMPFDSADYESGIHVTGTPDNPPGQSPEAEINFVSLHYFKTMGIPLLRGRDFGPEDAFGKPKVTIIDESLAARYFPGKDPIGQHIDDNQNGEDPTGKNVPPLTVVGVVGRTRNGAPGDEPGLEHMPQMHFCSPQFDDRTSGTVVVRTVSADPLKVVDAVKREVLALDPEVPVAEVTTMEHSIADKLAPRRLTMVLLGTFAGLALVLASIGLYGVMALTVTQRTRELGIRLALGAQRGSVLGLIMRQGAILVGIGLTVGLAAALVGGRLLTSFLYNVNGSDPLTLGIVVFTLAGAALLACWLPAQRATRVDPMVALRED